VQRFATNCTKDWLGVGYKDRLSMLHLTTLEARQTILKNSFLYEVLNDLAFFPNSSIIPRPNTSHDTRSHTLTLQVPFAHIVSSRTPSAVILIDSGMNCHLKLYHLPPLPPLREFVTIMYPTNNYPSPHYVFVYVLFHCRVYALY